MAKFLDKKERVIDFQLTPYGKHRLSVGQLKPEYYAFFDTGVLYDSEYGGFKEVQTKVHERIKTETQFIEGILLFEEAENSVPPSTFIGGEMLGFSGTTTTGGTLTAMRGSTVYEDFMYMGRLAYGMTLTDEEIIALAEGDPTTDLAGIYRPSLFDLDIAPQRYVPKPEILSFESAIGDARFEGDNTQASPAWKLITCQGEMSNIQRKDTTKYNFSSASYDNEVTEFNIPQIDVAAYYTQLISAPAPMLDTSAVSEFVSETMPFKGGNTIKLIRDDVMVYAEELNTELLTENFDVEIFEMTLDTGVTTAAEAIIAVAATAITAGDTVTISDGITSQTFEFIANSKPLSVPSAGNIGVVVSSNYEYDGGSVNTQGTVLNFLSALNQDDGSTTRGYPTDHDKDDTGDILKGRCKYLYPAGCYTGNHNLKISIDESQISEIIGYAFDNPFNITLTNNNTTQGNPNQTITTTAAAARISPTGFSGGYTAQGTQLKRKYFKNENPQIVDGLMISGTPEEAQQPELTTDAVDYFFNVLTDKEANGKIACACANTFNKNSYYVDIDFDCAQEKFKEIYYDIYGSATSPEICNLPAENVTELRDFQPDVDDCEDNS